MTKLATTTLFTALLAGAAVASADTESADAAMQRGQAAMKAGRIHEACQAYEASEKLGPNPNTELALAQCYEQDAKPVAAAKLYRSLAEADADRRKTYMAKAGKLEVKAPKLRIVLNSRPEGLVVKVDGAQVPSTAGLIDVLVDLGPHEVVATAPGFEGHASAPVDRDRQIVDVIVRLEPKADAMPAPAAATQPAPAAAPAPEGTEPVALKPAPAPAEPELQSGDHRKRNGAIIGAVGLGALVGAVVFFSASSSKFDDEHALCPSSRCATDADLAMAHSLLDDGHAYRGVSIGMGIGGVALIGVGAYLLLAPHNEAASHLAFEVGAGRSALSYVGHF